MYLYGGLFVPHEGEFKILVGEGGKQLKAGGWKTVSVLTINERKRRIKDGLEVYRVNLKEKNKCC